MESERSTYNTDSRALKYIFTAALGMAAGGMLVLLATEALPKMMSSMMQGMMSNMGEAGCDPAEM